MTIKDKIIQAKQQIKSEQEDFGLHDDFHPGDGWIPILLDLLEEMNNEIIALKTGPVKLKGGSAYDLSTNKSLKDFKGI